MSYTDYGIDLMRPTFEMNPTTMSPKACVAMLAMLFVAMECRTAAPSASPESATPSPCVAPEYRQFDFWSGDWDAFDIDNPNTAVARTRVDQILGRCVLREDYQDTNGMKGQSFSIYDASRKVWHQTWVTNRGRLLVLEGKFQNSEMVLTGTDPAAGSSALVRGTWKAVNGGVRETGVTSSDGGKTWKPWFDLVFRPRGH